jgi:predicted permease
MRAMLQDLQYAFRTLRKAPGFSIVAIISLALGIGANTAIFSLLDQLLLRTLPVRDPGGIVGLASRGNHYGSNWGMDAMSYPMYKDFRDRAEVFDGVICRRSVTTNFGYSSRVERAMAELVSGNYFNVLGVAPAFGRVFTPDDDKQKLGHPVVVLSYDFWRARFGADPGILNRTVYVNNAPYTVIGVAQPGFSGVEIGEASQMFIPVQMQEQIIALPKLLEDRRTRFLNVFARLKPGVSIVQAKAAVQPLFHQILEGEVREEAFAHASQEDKDSFLRSSMDVFRGGTGTSWLRRRFTTPVYVLMGLVAFVLLIACANLANLQLARATARGKEIAVRLALGASRFQIMRQLLVESLLISTTAGVAGLLVGQWLLKALLSMHPTDTSSLTIQASIDFRVLAFNFAVAVLVGILFGLAPAWHATRPDVASTLKDQATSVAGGTHARFRKALLVGQVTMSLILLVGAGLFVNSLMNLRNLDPGFKAENLMVFGVDPASAGYKNDRVRDYYRILTERLSTLPGVIAVGHANMGIVTGDEWDSSVTIEGSQSTQSSKAWAYMNHISPGYFQSLGTGLVAGRDFRWSDAQGTPKVCIVNQRLVKEYFPNKDPIGRHIGMGSDPGTKADIEIIGVVKDFKYETMREDIGRQMYRPFQQMDMPLNMFFYVRSFANPNDLTGAIRAEARNLDQNVPIYGMRTMTSQIDRNLVTERLVATLSAAFGILATLLAVIGLYGVMAYLVGRRSREIGIRMALGAASGNVIWMILREVVVLVGIGVALGVCGSLALTRLVRSQLFGVTPWDPRVIALAMVSLSAVALFAGFLPARRASRTDPAHVLRYE